MEINDISPRSRLVAVILCFILGIFGAHRFYLGKIGTGVLMFLTFGGFTIWMWIDLIVLLVGSFHDSEGRLVFKWTEPGSL